MKSVQLGIARFCGSSYPFRNSFSDSIISVSLPFAPSPVFLSTFSTILIIFNADSSPLYLGWKFNFEELPICQSMLAEVVHLKQNNSPGCHISGDVFLPKDKGQFVLTPIEV